MFTQGGPVSLWVSHDRERAARTGDFLLLRPLRRVRRGGLYFSVAPLGSPTLHPPQPSRRLEGREGGVRPARRAICDVAVRLDALIHLFENLCCNQLLMVSNGNDFPFFGIFFDLIGLKITFTGCQKKKMKLGWINPAVVYN